MNDFHIRCGDPRAIKRTLDPMPIHPVRRIRAYLPSRAWTPAPATIPVVKAAEHTEPRIHSARTPLEAEFHGVLPAGLGV
jgi:hypothetical protein